MQQLIQERDLSEYREPWDNPLAALADPAASIESNSKGRYRASWHSYALEWTEIEDPERPKGKLSNIRPFKLFAQTQEMSYRPTPEEKRGRWDFVLKIQSLTEMFNIVRRKVIKGASMLLKVFKPDKNEAIDKAALRQIIDELLCLKFAVHYDIFPSFVILAWNIQQALFSFKLMASRTLCLENEEMVVIASDETTQRIKQVTKKEFKKGHQQILKEKVTFNDLETPKQVSMSEESTDTSSEKTEHPKPFIEQKNILVIMDQDDSSEETKTMINRLMASQEFLQSQKENVKVVYILIDSSNYYLARNNSTKNNYQNHAKIITLETNDILSYVNLAAKQIISRQCPSKKLEYQINHLNLIYKDLKHVNELCNFREEEQSIIRNFQRIIDDWLEKFIQFYERFVNKQRELQNKDSSIIYNSLEVDSTQPNIQISDESQETLDSTNSRTLSSINDTSSFSSNSRVYQNRETYFPLDKQSLLKLHTKEFTREEQKSSNEEDKQDNREQQKPQTNNKEYSASKTQGSSTQKFYKSKFVLNQILIPFFFQELDYRPGEQYNFLRRGLWMKNDTMVRRKNYQEGQETRIFNDELLSIRYIYHQFVIELEEQELLNKDLSVNVAKIEEFFKPSFADGAPISPPMVTQNLLEVHSTKSESQLTELSDDGSSIKTEMEVISTFDDDEDSFQDDKNQQVEVPQIIQTEKRPLVDPIKDAYLQKLKAFLKGFLAPALEASEKMRKLNDLAQDPRNDMKGQRFLDFRTFQDNHMFEYEVKFASTLDPNDRDTYDNRFIEAFNEQLEKEAKDEKFQFQDEEESKNPLREVFLKRGLNFKLIERHVNSDQMAYHKAKYQVSLFRPERSQPIKDDFGLWNSSMIIKTTNRLPQRIMETDAQKNIDRYQIQAIQPKQRKKVEIISIFEKFIIEATGIKLNANTGEDIYNNMEIRSLTSFIDPQNSNIFEERQFPNFLKMTRSYDIQSESIYFKTIIVAIASLSLRTSTKSLHADLKHELDRWKLVGDSTINFAVVLEIWLTSNYTESVRSMNEIKIQRIKQESIAKAMAESQWVKNYLEDMNDQSGSRDLCTITQQIAGFLTIYIGLDTALVFLQEIGVTKYRLPDTKKSDNRSELYFNQLIHMSDLYNQLMDKMNNTLGRVGSIILERMSRDIDRKEYPDTILRIIRFATADKNNGVNKQAWENISFNLSTHSQRIEKNKEVELFSQLRPLAKSVQETIQNKIDLTGLTMQDNQYLFLQAFTHVSFKDDPLFAKEPNKSIREDLFHFNYERLEYIGDVIMNLSVVKKFYHDTIIGKEQWHKKFFPPNELHKIKTYFTSNEFLSFQTFDNYFFCLPPQMQRDYPLLIQKKNSYSGDNETDYKKQISKFLEVFQEKFSHLHNMFWKKLEEVGEIQKHDSSMISRSLLGKKFNPKNSITSEEEYFSSIEYEKLKEYKVKYFADILEATVGAIFLATGNFFTADMSAFRMLSSNAIVKMPFIENPKVVCQQVFKSKYYTRDLILTHKIDESRSDSVYISGMIEVAKNSQQSQQIQLEVRRVKFTRHAKEKVQKFYFDLQKYLLEAYYIFETQFFQSADSKVKRPSANAWLKFNKIFRKDYSSINDNKNENGINLISQISKKMQEYSFTDSSMKRLQFSNEEKINFMTKAFDQIQLEEKLLPIPIAVYFENERCREPQVSDLVQRVFGEKVWLPYYNQLTFLEFLKQLTDDQLEKFFIELAQFEHLSSYTSSMRRPMDRSFPSFTNPIIESDYASQISAGCDSKLDTASNISDSQYQKTSPKPLPNQ